MATIGWVCSSPRQQRAFWGKYGTFRQTTCKKMGIGDETSTLMLKSEILDLESESGFSQSKKSVVAESRY